MKILLSWLNDYIKTGLAAEQIAQVLSDVGLPCEGIDYVDDDAVIDIEVTSNRGDCLSYIGIARELAAATGKELRIPGINLDESDTNIAEFASVEIIEPDLCGRYTARVIENVRIGPSPDWLRKRLEAVGLRSVNNVVDATNYAMMETGQPPHAFDYAKVTNGKIIVRKAMAGERIVSIDGTTCDLAADMLIIADPRGPIAIAGVMGGLNTEVGDATTTILLEDAYFDPVCVRRTSRKLALPSEAAFRFERTVDIEMVDWASKRTAQLITQVAGGRAAKGVADIYPGKPKQKEVTLRLSRLGKLLSIEVNPEKVLQILSSLNFKPIQKGDLVICLVPSWRSDIYREVDLIEEVIRVYGYDKIPSQNKIEIETVPVDHRQKLSESVGMYLNGCGFYETINVSFVSDSVAELFTNQEIKQHLSVKDETRKSDNLLRQTLLGSLLGVLKTNLNARNRPCRIYEIADTFVPTEVKDVLPVEKTKLGLVCDSSFRDLRGVIEALVKSISRDAEIEFKPASIIWAEVGAEILVNSRLIGLAGIFSQTIRQGFDFKDLSPCGAELDFEQFIVLQSTPIKLKSIPRFPAIERDLSIVVNEQIRWTDIVEAVKKRAPLELEDIRFVDIYHGKGIPSGQKSVTLSLRFRDQDGTLTHETVDGFQAVIIQSLSDSISAELRTI
ncbi:MAG: phenylalanine--tRNA ligase subunit beta [Planctomycetes bacterium RBG_13_44_8b]|nr:MAG: phenylalanine--tRNA ligase subunit beta [Planctomycetes bacterium RBG_13_44_8b]